MAMSAKANAWRTRCAARECIDRLVNMTVRIEMFVHSASIRAPPNRQGPPKGARRAAIFTTSMIQRMPLHLDRHLTPIDHLQPISKPAPAHALGQARYHEPETAFNNNQRYAKSHAMPSHLSISAASSTCRRKERLSLLNFSQEVASVSISLYRRHDMFQVSAARR